LNAFRDGPSAVAKVGSKQNCKKGQRHFLKSMPKERVQSLFEQEYRGIMTKKVISIFLTAKGGVGGRSLRGINEWFLFMNGILFFVYFLNDCQSDLFAEEETSLLTKNGCARYTNNCGIA